jgi:hypothetical protein
LYVDGNKDNKILDELKADAFKLAVGKVQSVGILETYKFFKEKRDEFVCSVDKLGRNMLNAYDLVIGKLWKYYKKEMQKTASGGFGFSKSL